MPKAGAPAPEPFDHDPDHHQDDLQRKASRYHVRAKASKPPAAQSGTAAQSATARLRPDAAQPPMPDGGSYGPDWPIPLLLTRDTWDSCCCPLSPLSAARIPRPETRYPERGPRRGAPPWDGGPDLGRAAFARCLRPGACGPVFATGTAGAADNRDAVAWPGMPRSRGVDCHGWISSERHRHADRYRYSTRNLAFAGLLRELSSPLEAPREAASLGCCRRSLRSDARWPPAHAPLG